MNIETTWIPCIDQNREHKLLVRSRSH